MGRNYIRRTNRQSWSQTAMSNAVAAVRTGQMGTLKAAKQFGVPHTTVQRLARQPGGTVKMRLGSRKPVFPVHMEHELVQNIKEMDRRLFGFTASELRKVAYQYAEINNLPHDFNDEKTGWQRLVLFIYVTAPRTSSENTRKYVCSKSKCI